MGRAFEYRKAAKLKRWGHMAKTFTRLGKQIAIAVKAPMKLMAFTRFASFSFTRVSYLANFTRSAVWKSSFSSW